MPRCEDAWVRRFPAQVKVTVKKPSHADLYSLSYATGGKASGPPQPLQTGTFDSDELASGQATWLVPFDHSSIFTLQTSGKGILQTIIEIDGKPVACNSGQHCQGACRAEGPGQLAGSWRVTIWPDKGAEE